MDPPVATCFKLYPWEWMLAEPYGRLALDPADPTVWIEPVWKPLLSNKALLALLWELYPGHPNLLPAYLDGPRELAGPAGPGYVAKPLLGREGAGIEIVAPGAAPGPLDPAQRLLLPAVRAAAQFRRQPGGAGQLGGAGRRRSGAVGGSGLARVGWAGHRRPGPVPATRRGGLAPDMPVLY